MRSTKLGIALATLFLTLQSANAAFLTGDNTAEANTGGLATDAAYYYTAGHVASTTGTAASAFVYSADWAGLTTSRIKVIVFDSGGTQLGISDPITVPATTPAWASATFSSGFTITSGQTYRLAMVANSGTIDSYHAGGSFLASQCTGTYSYASPAGAIASDAGNINRGMFSVYIDGTTSGAAKSKMTLLGVF